MRVLGKRCYAVRIVALPMGVGQMHRLCGNGTAGVSCVCVCVGLSVCLSVLWGWVVASCRVCGICRLTACCLNLLSTPPPLSLCRCLGIARAEHCLYSVGYRFLSRWQRYLSAYTGAFSCVPPNHSSINLTKQR